MFYHLIVNSVLAFLLLVSSFNSPVLAAEQSSFTSLLQQSEKQIKKGKVKEAILLLESAWQIAEQAQSKQQKIAAAAELGSAYLRGRYFTQAEKWLKLSDELAETLNNPQLSALVNLRLGAYYSAIADISQAQSHNALALQAAKKANDIPLTISAYLSLAKHEQFKQFSINHISRAYALLKQVPDSVKKAELTLAAGYQALQLDQTQMAYLFFKKLLSFSQQARARSQAYGYLAELYEQQNKIEDAFFLNEQAIAADTSADLMILWQWQRARLFTTQNNSHAALSAYRQTLDYLQQIRADIPVQYLQGESSFRRTYAPIYLAMIKLLLQPENNNQDLLLEAQSIWESFKTTELQDYFKDTCIVEQQPNEQWQTVREKTAVLYPIVLPDTLELIIRFNDSVQHYSVPISSKQIESTVEQVLLELNQAKQVLTANQTLYKWLIAPIAQQLTSHDVETLIYIPDAALRKIPLGVLSDGETFLLQHYAIATEPGLSIFKQATQNQTPGNILLAGMGRPGPVVEEIIKKNLLTDANDTSSILLDSTDFRSLEKITNLEQRSQKRLQMRAAKLQDSLALPNVNKELAQIASMLPSTILENEAFTLNQFENHLKEGYGAIHMASHGYFSGNPEKSFIMTYDRVLNMKKLMQLFQSEHFTETPVELLTLSACQTAKGDDRAPLGLSGIVIQAGVKSAIGTLWSVADEVAQQLFTEFYKHYPLQGSVKALQTAQQHIKNNTKYTDPLYWSPFILVGDWH